MSLKKVTVNGRKVKSGRLKVKGKRTKRKRRKRKMRVKKYGPFYVYIFQL